MSYHLNIVYGPEHELLSLPGAFLVTSMALCFMGDCSHYEGEYLCAPMDLSLPVSKKDKAAPIGMQYGCDPFDIKVATKGSWQKIKITRGLEPVRVTVHILSNRSATEGYEESIEFEAGRGELGQLFAWLDQIRKRDSWEHMWRAKLFRKRQTR